MAGLSIMQVAFPERALAEHPRDDHERGSNDDLPSPSQTLGRPGDVVLPWLDQPAPNPAPAAIGNFLVWEELDTWLTPADNFHFVTHFRRRACHSTEKPSRRHVQGVSLFSRDLHF